LHAQVLEPCRLGPSGSPDFWLRGEHRDPVPVDGGQVTAAQAIDGDTVVLKDGHQVRYLGINAPEHDQPHYEEALETNWHLLEGKEASMAQDVQPTDRYGRA
jgi:endonuclease YncB( thermonuclease family)